MAEPNEAHRAVIDEMLHARGTLVLCFSQIEFVLLDLLVRSKSMREYPGRDTKPPYPIEKRVNAVKRLVSLPGRLKPYQNEICLRADRLMDFKYIRDAFAHGMTHYEFWNDGHKLTFRYYKPAKTGSIRLFLWETDIIFIRDEMQKIVLFTNSTMQFFAGVYGALDLERLWEASGPPEGATRLE